MKGVQDLPVHFLQLQLLQNKKFFKSLLKRWEQSRNFNVNFSDFKVKLYNNSEQLLSV